MAFAKLFGISRTIKIIKTFDGVDCRAAFVAGFGRATCSFTSTDAAYQVYFGFLFCACVVVVFCWFCFLVRVLFPIAFSIIFISFKTICYRRRREGFVVLRTFCVCLACVFGCQGFCWQCVLCCTVCYFLCIVCASIFVHHVQRVAVVGITTPLCF